jgi:transglutaminase-like putative cysteine protease
MNYTIRHTTRFRYSAPITQSVMEVYMQPRTEGFQRCLSFHLNVTPHATVMSHQDFLGNMVHHFDIPGAHQQLTITAESLIEIRPRPEFPSTLSPDAWDELDTTEFEMLLPSHFTRPTPMLEELRKELKAERRDDPLGLLRELTTTLYDAFEYAPDSTAVDSPIDDALQSRQGVCQDFTHIMIALVRPLGIPCRYMSGYLYHRNGARSSPDASHAWMEALLPGLGWIGFDPTNNLIAGERHIRVALGRDYADVPPTRGVFKGSADTELSVGVRVSLADDMPTEMPAPRVQWSTQRDDPDNSQAQEQQQQ